MLAIDSEISMFRGTFKSMKRDDFGMYSFYYVLNNRKKYEQFASDDFCCETHLLT